MVGITLSIIASILPYIEIEPVFVKHNLHENPGNTQREAHRFNL